MQIVISQQNLKLENFELRNLNLECLLMFLKVKRTTNLLCSEVGKIPKIRMRSVNAIIFNKNFANSSILFSGKLSASTDSIAELLSISCNIILNLDSELYEILPSLSCITSLKFDRMKKLLTRVSKFIIFYTYGKLDIFVIFVLYYFIIYSSIFCNIFIKLNQYCYIQ